MKRLIPATLPVTLDFDLLGDYPEDVERMVTAAANPLDDPEILE